MEKILLLCSYNSFYVYTNSVYFVISYYKKLLQESSYNLQLFHHPCIFQKNYKLGKLLLSIIIIVSLNKIEEIKSSLLLNSLLHYFYELVTILTNYYRVILMLRTKNNCN